MRRRQKKQSIATVFISGLSGTADDVRETPLTVCTYADGASEAARSRNIVANISQSSVRKKPRGLLLAYTHYNNARNLRENDCLRPNAA